MSRRTREVRTGRPQSRAPWRADAGEQGHRRREGTQTARLAPETRRGSHVQPTRPPDRPQLAPASPRREGPAPLGSLSREYPDPAGWDHLPPPRSPKLGDRRPQPHSAKPPAHRDTASAWEGRTFNTQAGF